MQQRADPQYATEEKVSPLDPGDDERPPPQEKLCTDTVLDTSAPEVGLCWAQLSANDLFLTIIALPEKLPVWRKLQ